jgi:hypothetical protein
MFMCKLSARTLQVLKNIHSNFWKWEILIYMYVRIADPFGRVKPTKEKIEKLHVNADPPSGGNQSPFQALYMWG